MLGQQRDDRSELGPPPPKPEGPDVTATNRNNPTSVLDDIRESRGPKLQDGPLWKRVLDYFAGEVPEAHRGYFAWWFCQTLINPKRGEEALCAVFATLGHPAKLLHFLGGLEEALCLPEFAIQRRWMALQGSLLTRLIGNWSGQRYQAEGYASSLDVTVAYVRVFLPILHASQRASLARQGLVAIRAHGRQAPERAPSSFPDLLMSELGPETIGELLEELSLGLELCAGLDLRPYLRKKAPLAATSQPGLQRCLNALLTLTAHPEWEQELWRQVASTGLSRKRLREVVPLLKRQGLSRLEKSNSESWDNYIERIPTLGQLLG